MSAAASSASSSVRASGSSVEPEWVSDATVEALALIAAQPVEVLVHSNLDDGFAALFQDLGSVMGAVLLERHIGQLIGVTYHVEDFDVIELHTSEKSILAMSLAGLEPLKELIGQFPLDRLAQPVGLL